MNPRGRSTIWLHPSIPLRFVFDDPEPAELSRQMDRRPRAVGELVRWHHARSLSTSRPITVADLDVQDPDLSVGKVEVEELSIDKLTVAGTVAGRRAEISDGSGSSRKPSACLRVTRCAGSGTCSSGVVAQPHVRDAQRKGDGSDQCYTRPRSQLKVESHDRDSPSNRIGVGRIPGQRDCRARNAYRLGAGVVACDRLIRPSPAPATYSSDVRAAIPMRDRSNARTIIWRSRVPRPDQVLSLSGH